jgi:hypothetical protein
MSESYLYWPSRNLGQTSWRRRLSRRGAHGILGLSLLFPMASHAKVGPDFDAYWQSPAVAARRPSLNSAPPGSVSEYDTRRGVPNFLWATAAAPVAPESARRSPEGAARWYAEQYAPWYGLPTQTVHAATVLNTLDTGRGGVVVTLGQTFDGVEVYKVRQNLLLDRNNHLVAISGSLHPGAPSSSFVGRDTDAIGAALQDLLGPMAAPPKLEPEATDTAGFSRYRLAARTSTSVTLDAPIRVKRVWFRLPDSLVAAWCVELQLTSGDGEHDAALLVIGDDDGRVLLRSNISKDQQFRVWADGSGDNRPQAGPVSDVLPHPTGQPDGTTTSLTESVLVDRAPFNAGPFGVPDPWLTSDVATIGNHVFAFADLYAPDGYSNGDASADGVSFTFDHLFDFNQQPWATYEQPMAGVTQAFYTANWLHDWYYDSGFTEANKNAQADNYGRGGAAGDRLEIRTLSPYVPDNARMNAPADGGTPILRLGAYTDVMASVTTGSGLDATNTNYALFGPTDFSVTGLVVVADDGVVSTSDGCQPLLHDVTGQIVLIDRGTCPYEAKVVNAEMAGAAGVIIATHTAGLGAPRMNPGQGSSATIPVLSVTYEFGQALRTAASAGPETATLTRVTGLYRDSALDTTIVSHEWGHLLQFRLHGAYSPSTNSTSEGWADFVGLHLDLRDGDTLDGTYAYSVYARGAARDAAYFGGRRYPYSTDMTKNPLTFGHIRASATLPPGVPVRLNEFAMNEVHNAGEVWGSMIWDCYMALQADAKLTGRRTFDEARRQMSDYVVAAMMMTPYDPTWTDQRDALLAAAQANDPADTAMFAEAFRRRGAGSCAYGPYSYSEDFEDVIESFELRANPFISTFDVTGTTSSCDGDIEIDAGEVGEFTFPVINGGMATATSVTMTVTSADPDVSFPDGTTAVVGPIPPLGVATATVHFALAPGYVPHDVMFVISLDSSDACYPTASFEWAYPLGTDTAANASTIDPIGPTGEGWSTDGYPAPFELLSENGNQWFKVTDPNHASESVLVTPAIEVGQDPFTLAFDHVYDLDRYDTGSDVYFFDGLVLEVSIDDGASWVDVAELADPGYTGMLYGGSYNPLGGRPAYVGINPSYPTSDRVTIPFETALAGKTVRFRFHFGSDAEVGADGWYIDNLEVTGAARPPFSGPVPSVPTAMFVDGDSDGVGGGSPVTVCPLPESGVLIGGDCDDTNPHAYPAATETCDAADNDCDGETDEGLGLGVACSAGVGACQSDGLAACDGSGGVACDAVALTASAETCDGIDNDCDGAVDDGFGVGELCSVGVGECEAIGLTVCALDGAKGCSVSAGAAVDEVCNGRDDDCDGETDDGLGLGEVCSVGVGACAQEGVKVCGGSGSVGCSVAAGAPADEVCNAIDDDCDGATDESASDAAVVFTDGDGDDFGAGLPMLSCSPKAGTVAKNGDCDDLAAATYPGAPEAPGDAVDRNCDGKLTPPAPTDGPDAGGSSDASDGPDAAAGGDATGGDATGGDTTGGVGATDDVGPSAEIAGGASGGCTTTGIGASTPSLLPLLGGVFLLLRWSRRRTNVG